MKASEIEKHIIKTGINQYTINRFNNMKQDIKLYLSPELKDDLEGKTYKQLVNAASLPGLYGPVIGMPDLHQGYGLPIGGIMASKEDGIVSAGAVGMDINCGVRLLASGLEEKPLSSNDYLALMKNIQERVPLGIGTKSPEPTLYNNHFKDILKNGSKKMISLGYGTEKDIELTEDQGCHPDADLDSITSKAYRRGNQLGTLGAGNHFIDICAVAEVFDNKIAEKFSLYEGQVTVLLHTGSRGFGHQICTDYMELMNQKAKIKPPVKGLAFSEINSREGQDYLGAMGCAVNFAYANRQLITFFLRQAFSSCLSGSGLEPIFDITHNVARWEDFSGQKLLIHRKGATRALPPHHRENPSLYSNTGHPVLIPGTMGTSSYVAVGTNKAEETFNSVNHGAGRTMSRRSASDNISRSDFEKSMQGIIHSAKNYKKVLDEAPDAYKDIDQIVDIMENSGIILKVARLEPRAVINR